MAWSFRRRVKLGPLNLNFSRIGMGASVGAGPFRTGVDARGRKYTSVRGPFGLYNRQYQTASDYEIANEEASPAIAALKDSIILLACSTIALLYYFTAEADTWLITFALIAGVPACASLWGYFRKVPAETTWYQIVNVIVKIEKWLFLGFLIVLLMALALASSFGGKRRRRG